jgi:hypothetical protein
MITDETKVMTEDIIKDVKRHSYYLKPRRNCLRLMAMIAGINCLSNHSVRFCPLEAMCSVRGANLVAGMCADYVDGPVNRPLTDDNV